MVSPRVGAMQLCKLCKHASELEQSRGGRAWRWQEVGGEGEGRSYHDTSPGLLTALFAPRPLLMSSVTMILICIYVICHLSIIFFFCPFGVLQYKFLSYMCYQSSESSWSSQSSEVFSLSAQVLYIFCNISCELI